MKDKNKELGRLLADTDNWPLTSCILRRLRREVSDWDKSGYQVLDYQYQIKPSNFNITLRLGGRPIRILISETYPFQGPEFQTAVRNLPGYLETELLCRNRDLSYDIQQLLETYLVETKYTSLKRFLYESYRRYRIPNCDNIISEYNQTISPYHWSAACRLEQQFGNIIGFLHRIQSKT